MGPMDTAAGLFPRLRLAGPEASNRVDAAWFTPQALGGETGASAPWTSGEHGPPAPDEIAMPAQQGLGGDEEADPGRAGQQSAETCERQTISSPPEWRLTWRSRTRSWCRRTRSSRWRLASERRR